MSLERIKQIKQERLNKDPEYQRLCRLEKSLYNIYKKASQERKLYYHNH